MKKIHALAIAFIGMQVVLASPAHAFLNGNLANWFWNVAPEQTMGVSPSEIRTVPGGELIMKVETDAYPGISTVSVMRNEQGVLQSLVYLSRSDGDKTFTLDQLRKAPAVLKNSSGRDVVLLIVEKDFTAEKGGHANVRFLESGLSGSYLNFRILLDVQQKIVLRSDPNPKDPESDGNEYTGVFNHVFMKKNTFFGKLVGIESITPSMK